MTGFHVFACQSRYPTRISSWHFDMQNYLRTTTSFRATGGLHGFGRIRCSCDTTISLRASCLLSLAGEGFKAEKWVHNMVHDMCSDHRLRCRSASSYLLALYKSTGILSALPCPVYRVSVPFFFFLPLSPVTNHESLLLCYQGIMQ